MWCCVVLFGVVVVWSGGVCWVVLGGAGGASSGAGAGRAVIRGSGLTLATV